MTCELHVRFVLTAIRSRIDVLGTIAKHAPHRLVINDVKFPKDQALGFGNHRGVEYELKFSRRIRAQATLDQKDALTRAAKREDNAS